MHMHVAIDGCLVAQARQPGSDLFVFHKHGRWSLLTVTTPRSANESARVSVHCLGSFGELARVLEQAWGPDTTQDLLAGVDETGNARLRRLPLRLCH